MDPKKGVSWQTVCYMLGEVMYGGRVTDDFDKRLLVTFTNVWFNETLLAQNFEFHKGYRVPMSRNLHTYTDYIASLPANDTPEVFGLHPNADITYQINTAKGKVLFSKQFSFFLLFFFSFSTFVLFALYCAADVDKSFYPSFAYFFRHFGYNIKCPTERRWRRWR